jgi:hypothetical protein
MERRVQKLTPIFKSPLGKDNWEIFKELMNTYSTNCSFMTSNEIFEAVCRTYAPLKGLHLKDKPELYVGSLNESTLENGRAYHIELPAKGPIFENRKDTNALRYIFK